MKRLTVILTGIILLVVAAVIIIGLNADKMVARYLHNFLDKEPLSGHVIGFSHFHFSWKERTVQVDSVRIAQDSTEMAGTESSLSIDMKIERIQISGVHFGRLLFRKVLKVDSLLIIRPEGHIFMANPKTSEKGNEDREAHPSGKKGKDPFLRKVILDAVGISNGELMLSQTNNTQPLYYSEGLNLLIRSFHADMRALDKPAEAISFGAILMNSDKQVIHLPDGFYNLEVDSLSLMDSGSKATIHSLRVIPQYSKERFLQKFGRQTDRFDVAIDLIALAGIDLKRAVFSREFFIRNIEIHRVHAEIYRDQNVPRGDEKIKPLLNESILKLKNKIGIDTLKLTDSYVKYEEVAPEKSEPASIFIDDFDLLLTNLTNHPEKIAQNASMNLSGGFLLQGAGKTVLEIGMPLDNPARKFTYILQLSDFSLPLLNDELLPSVNVKVYDGQLRASRFEIVANSDSAWGKAWVHYTDVKLEIFKKKTKDVDHHVNKFLSFLGNTLIHKNNPSQRTGIERIGIIRFERNKYRSMIGFLVKAPLSGVIHILSPEDNHVEKTGQPKKKK